jgi:hypothetical protein
MRLAEGRAFVMQALRQSAWNQVGELFIAVASLKAKAQGLDRAPDFHVGRFLGQGDRELILEVIWSLIIQAILVPSLNDANQS